jgi:predicted Zn finger-like uncharacterized protein
MADEDIEPLVTECPNCQTRFRVTENQLQIAAGRVRCGACLTVFKGADHLLWDDEPQFENDGEAQSALDELLDELGDDDSSDARAPADGEGDQADEEWLQPEHQLYGGHEAPTTLAPEEIRRIEQTLLGEHPDDVDLEADFEIEELVIDQVAEEALEEQSQQDPGDPQQPPGSEVWQETVSASAPAPPFAASGAPSGSPFVSGGEPKPAPDVKEVPFAFGQEPARRRWWVSVAMAAAIAALVGQVLWFQFDTWARDSATRPLYGVICQVLGCELPTLRDVDRMLAQNLIVRSHPEVANALLVDAIIVNQAPFVQPFPVLELRFTSLGGNLVAGRRFQPAEYLAGELAGASVMAIQTPIHVELAIEDPGDEAVNYFLTFREDAQSLR